MSNRCKEITEARVECLASRRHVAKKRDPPGFLRAYFENHRASLYVQSHTTWTVLLSKGSFGDERAQGHMEGDPGLVLRLTHTPPFKEETSLLPRGSRA